MPAAGSDGVIVRDLATGRAIARYDTPGPVTAVTFSADGSTVVAGYVSTGIGVADGTRRWTIR